MKVVVINRAILVLKFQHHFILKWRNLKNTFSQNLLTSLRRHRLLGSNERWTEWLCDKLAVYWYNFIYVTQVCFLNPRVIGLD